MNWYHYLSQGGRRPILRDPDPESESGGGGDDKDKEKGPLKVELPEEVMKSFKSALEKAGDANNLAMRLFDDNYKLREERRELKNKAENPADSKELASYKELGSPEEIKNQLKEYRALKQKDEKRTASEKAEKAAAVLGYNPKVFSLLVTSEKLDLVIKAVEVEGQDEKVTKVFYKAKGRDAENQEITEHLPVEDWVKSEHPELLDSLSAVSNEQSENGSPRGHLFPRQLDKKRETPAGGVKGAASSYLARKYGSKEKAKAS